MSQPKSKIQQPYFTIVNPKKCNIIEVQDTDFEIAIMNMFKNLKEDTNKSQNEVYGNTVG